MALWVTFWGTRGSIPVSLDSASIRDKLAHAIVAASGKRLDTQEKARAWVDSELDFAVSHTFGGNSACVQLDAGDDEHVLCDLGSGVRAFGNHVFTRDGPAKANVFHVFQSHLHWDHIMGFPFFAPAYVAGNRIRIYGCHTNLEEALRRQQDPPSFPVPFDRLGASIEVVALEQRGRGRVVPACQCETPGAFPSRTGQQRRAHRPDLARNPALRRNLANG